MKLLWLVFTLVCSQELFAQGGLTPASLEVEVGAAAQLKQEARAQWVSSDPQVAQVFQNGFVVGLSPGHVRVHTPAAEWLVTVKEARQPLLDPATLQQYPDNRSFMVGSRKCYGSELNGQRAVEPEEKRFTRSNRVINPKPLRADRPLDWELLPETEVFDGAGVLLGTVPPTLKIDDHSVPVSMFNFGASKVLGGRICVYAFSVAIKPSPAVTKLMDTTELKRNNISTSAWLPLEGVLDKETLLERIGLGKARPFELPLEAAGYRVTGGSDKIYMTEYGELNIVRDVRIGAVPSHYLRRPSGTINLVYSVPGFGLGGQGVDSFLITDGLEFYPAKGAKIFTQPTYFPARSPRAGHVSAPTMTFLYGAIKSKGAPPVYGWVAKEALSSMR